MKLPKFSVDRSKAETIIVQHEKKQAVKEFLVISCLFGIIAYLVVRSR